ncbi:dihydroxyacetone kinase phosphoryl donor subunit DhaM [Actinopolyspora saharensis]|uniref:Phosphocarrier protein HPr n=1 Tax=Actinopolyspora saharensis TaxID=995062 RepID=A0A1H1DUP5_9ACTN|nr:dihydroxyacetone kinase phosphoryl donor subunit DhaM [Actinopolyspora saharensis]SDQ80060.1 Phosphocarrier protein HPr /dihydroxyacetone kinase DhaM subunit [Actinopolyspora saharensis]
MRVGLVVVSHSGALSDGVVELVGQMAPQVRVNTAGGTSDGGVGTDFEATSAALAAAETGSGVVLLYDLGSARMTAELAVESLAEPNTALVVDAPLVEGAVAAAVAAQNGDDLEAVARAAEQAAGAGAGGAEQSEQAAATSAAEGASVATRVERELTLENEVGLHARPAALLARSLTGLEAAVTVSSGESTADARSVLGVMGLGARKGDRIGLRATGPDAETAVQRITELVEHDFDE